MPLFNRASDTQYGPTFGDRASTPLSTRFLDLVFPRLRPSTTVSWYQHELPSFKLSNASPLIRRNLLCSDDASTSSCSTAAKNQKPGSEDHQISRLESLRSSLWAICPYPCFGRWNFLLNSLSKMPWYESIVVSKAIKGATVLEIGCGVGGDIRQLGADIEKNVKSMTGGHRGDVSNIYALESRPEIWEVGNDLFGKDERINFIAGDIVFGCQDGKSLANLRGRVDIVVMCCFLDQFSWYHQEYRILDTVVKLSKVGTQVVGYTLGTTTEQAGEFDGNGSSTTRFFHDPNISFKTLWLYLGQTTQTRWTVEVANLMDLEDLGWEEGDFQWIKKPKLQALQFVVTRVE